MRTDNNGEYRPRRPRFQTRDPRQGEQRRSYAQLHAEIESLHRRLAETEERLKALEAECERRRKVVRACSMCGRVSTRPGPDSRCPYCENGQLRRV